MDKSEVSTTYTYFDTTGRPTYLFEKHNTVDEHNGPIRVIFAIK